MPFYQFDGWTEDQKKAFVHKQMESIVLPKKLQKAFGPGVVLQKQAYKQKRQDELEDEAVVRAGLVDVQGAVFYAGKPVEVQEGTELHERVLARVKLGELKEVKAEAPKKRGRPKKAETGGGTED